MVVGCEYVSVGADPSENTGHVTNRKVRPTGAGGFMVCQEKARVKGWGGSCKNESHTTPWTPGGGRRQQGMAKEAKQ